MGILSLCHNSPSHTCTFHFKSNTSLKHLHVPNQRSPSTLPHEGEHTHQEACAPPQFSLHNPFLNTSSTSLLPIISPANHPLNHLSITNGPLRSTFPSHNSCYIFPPGGLRNQGAPCMLKINECMELGHGIIKGKGSHLLGPSSPVAMYKCAHAPQCNKQPGQNLESTKSQFILIALKK